MPLVSWVDACLEEQIVEPLSPRSKAAKRQEEEGSGPDFYRKRMLLDIHCGSLVKTDGDLQGWFQKYSASGQGALNQNEFVIALDQMGVEADLREKESVFAYFTKKVATKRDTLAEYNKRAAYLHTLAVRDLAYILDDDLPDHSTESIEAQLLKKVAFSLTD